jgi:hypothetical protein
MLSPARVYSSVAKVLPVSIFAIFVYWILFPAWNHRWGALPTSRVTVATVPMLNAWIIAWNAEQLANGFPDYWNAPIFHPETNALAYNEPQPLTGLVAPVVWLTGSPNFAYLAYLALSLLLNGLFTFRLVATLGVNFWLRIVGGMSVMLQPLVLQNIDVLQLVPLWGFLWSFDCLYKLSRAPSPAIGLQLGAALTVVFWASVHQGFLFSLLLLPALPLLIRQQQRTASVRALGVAGLLAILMVAPIVYPIAMATRDARFERSEATVRGLSATTDQWLRSVKPAVATESEEREDDLRGLNPGWLRIALVALLFVLEARRVSNTRRRFRTFLAVIALGGFVLSYGANLEFFGWNIWFSLCSLVPPLAGVRSVYRFAYFSQLALIVLATLGIQQFWLRGRAWSRSKGTLTRVGWVNGLGIILMLGMLVEVPPPKLRMIATTDVRFPPDWIAYLREHAAPGDVVLCLPFFAGNTERDFELTTLRMLQLSGSGLRLVNGYSGFFPSTWHEHVQSFSAPARSLLTADELREAQVRYIVVDVQRTQAPVLRDNSNDEVPTDGQVTEGRALINRFQGSRAVHVFELMDRVGSQNDK